MNDNDDSFWRTTARQFGRRHLGMAALFVLACFVIVGIYAPFIASSKPLCVVCDGQIFFPLFRYLFYRGFFTTRLDLFFNLLMFTLPLFIACLYLRPYWRRIALPAVLVLHTVLFLFIAFREPHDPAADTDLLKARLHDLSTSGHSWQFELDHMNAYAKLNLLLRYRLEKEENQRLMPYQQAYAKQALHSYLEEALRDKKNQLLVSGTPSSEIPSDKALEKAILADTSPEVLRRLTALPTLWEAEKDNQADKIERLTTALKADPNDHHANEELQYLRDRDRWLVDQNAKISVMVMPLFRPFHWEDDAGGAQALNQFVPWWELTRTDRKDLSAALVFGVRISIVVGICAVALGLLIGIPVGCLAGYYAGTLDIVVCRLLEIWEAMPTFFMLLLVVAVTQSKSIFLVIAIIGFFGWTGFSRYIRGEFFKQRNLPYVEACLAQGFDDSYIIYRHILPNAIPPLLTLLPFAVMGAISTEAGLSFLGLGEEGSCSWGVLMDEGRRAFPGESYLLWPPAILLTALLVAIALVGDALRDSIDPRLHRHT